MQSTPQHFIGYIICITAPPRSFVSCLLDGRKEGTHNFLRDSDLGADDDDDDDDTQEAIVHSYYTCTNIRDRAFFCRSLFCSLLIFIANRISSEY